MISFFLRCSLVIVISAIFSILYLSLNSQVIEAQIADHSSRRSAIEKNRLVLDKILQLKESKTLAENDRAICRLYSTLYPLTSSPSHLSSIVEEPPINNFSYHYESFQATAYSLRGRTANGNRTRKGIIAADRNVLPLGSKVHVQAGNYTGEYIVADTGSAIRGRKVDIWVPSSREAKQFGRRKIKLTVLKYPVHPLNSKAGRAKNRTRRKN